jgi:hypothetical protein
MTRNPVAQMILRLIYLSLACTNVYSGEKDSLRVGDLLINDAQETEHPSFTYKFLQTEATFRFYDGTTSPCLENTRRDCQRVIAFLDHRDTAQRVLIDSYHPDGGELKIEAIGFYNLDEDPGKEMIVLLSRHYSNIDTQGHAFDIHFYDNQLIEKGSLKNSITENLSNTKQLRELTDILPKKLANGFEGKTQGENSFFLLKTISAIKQRLNIQAHPFSE